MLLHPAKSPCKRSGYLYPEVDIDCSSAHFSLSSKLQLKEQNYRVPSSPTATMASQSPSSKDARSFREHLPDLTVPRFTTMQKQDVYEYAKAFKENKQPPWLHALYCHWLELFNEPFKGVTNDGKW